ncbi:chemotaxis protein CheD [Candidatus Bathyarchaeota archaeon]|nr:chemotaxis protein CheD [Candidatus Bathyarchaeota archaeon]
MADAKIENKSLWLVTNVGSCIALCMYDKFNRCGGMAHIMLPKSNGNGARVLPYKYADTAVPALANAIRKMGNGKSFLIAKIAGGASMFSDIKCHLIKIGQKNIETVKEALSANNIPLVAEDVGGNHGRKIAFNVTTGTVIVRSLNGVEKKL